MIVYGPIKQQISNIIRILRSEILMSSESVIHGSLNIALDIYSVKIERNIIPLTIAPWIAN